MAVDLLTGDRNATSHMALQHIISVCLILLLTSCGSGGSGGATVVVQAICSAPDAGPAAQVVAPVKGVKLLSNRAVTVIISGIDLQASVANPPSYTLSSVTDSGFVTPVSATKLGYDRQVTGFTTAAQPVSESRLHLFFPKPMREAQRYTLHLGGAVTGPGVPLPAAASNIDFTFSSCRVSPSIQVSQEGYMPSSPKFAYVGNWLGTAGAMPVDQSAWQVLDAATGKAVLSGTLALRAAADAWSGNDVYEADLSALNTSGSYRLFISGMGVSYPFSVDANMAENIYRKVMRVFYHVRNGATIVAPYATPGYERPSGGVPANLDGVFHAALTDPAYPFNNGEVVNQYRPISKGWFDAGDYGQYITNAAIVYWAVGLALDLAPGAFADGELNIPESVNGIPDIIDELGWGVDWALSMQDVDGGVYFRIASETWDSSLPNLIALPRFIYEKTTHATASFAAMAAIYARLIKPYDAVRAAAVSAAAENAWTFLQTHAQWPAEGVRYVNPPLTHAGEYADASALDNLLWAAAELFRTTGNPVYPDPNAAQARASIISGADWRVRQSTLHPYRAAIHANIGFAGWGSFGQSSRAVLPLLQGYALSGNATYLATAQTVIYPQLGANPQSICYITGSGSFSPIDPLFKLSQYDAQQLPLPGIPVNGPHFHLPASIAAHGLVNAAYLPVEQPTVVGDFTTAYPVLRRYTDSHLLPPMSEPTVAEDAEVAMAFALISRAAAVRFY